MAMALPAPWLSYKTKDGKEYYYNPQTKVTTWTRPAGGSSSSSLSSSSGKSTSKQKTSSASALPTGGAGRGGLLAQIQLGTSLKKVSTVEKTLFAGHPSGRSSGGAGPKDAVAAPAASGGGGLGGMMAAIKAGGNLKKPASSGAERESSASGPSSTSSSVGGFAEIMRKNREAAARKSGNGATPPTHSYSSAPSTPRQVPVATSSRSNESGNSAVEMRLAAIEGKLDKIMAHLGIS